MGHLDIGRQAFGIDGVAVILGGDGDRPIAEVLHWLIPATMTELQFERLAAKGMPEDLMTQADGEDRLLAHKLSDFAVDVIKRRRIARPVREKDAVWISSKHFARRC